MLYSNTDLPGQCPKSHPFVYLDGLHCCRTNKEKYFSPHGVKCDGSVLQRDSLCCEGDQHVMCPAIFDYCEDYTKPSKSVLHQFSVEMCFLYAYQN